MIGGVTLGTLGILWVGALLGAIASGGAGFAFVLAASSIWLHVLDPLRTALLAVACSTLMQLMTIWPLRHHLDLGRLWPFLIAGLIGVPFGVQLLAHTDGEVLKRALGVFLAAFGSYVLLGPELPLVRRGGRAADACIGFFGGVLGGLGGYSGVMPTIWTQLRGWPKHEARAVYQPFIIVVQIATLLLVGSFALDRHGLMLIGAVAPALVLGGWLGWRLYGRLDERRFRRMLALVLVVSGVALAL